jgi:hypothetical protein
MVRNSQNNWVRNSKQLDNIKFRKLDVFTSSGEWTEAHVVSLSKYEVSCFQGTQQSSCPLSPSPYLKTETNSISETLCFI